MSSYLLPLRYGLSVAGGVILTGPTGPAGADGGAEFLLPSHLGIAQAANLPPANADVGAIWTSGGVFHVTQLPATKLLRVRGVSAYRVTPDTIRVGLWDAAGNALATSAPVLSTPGWNDILFSTAYDFVAGDVGRAFSYGVAAVQAPFNWVYVGGGTIPQSLNIASRTVDNAALITQPPYVAWQLNPQGTITGPSLFSQAGFARPNQLNNGFVFPVDPLLVLA